MDQQPKLTLPKWRRYITIEPIVFFMLLATTLSDNVKLDLLTYRTCRFYEGVNKSQCDILHQNSSSDEAIDLQRKFQPHTSLILVLQSCMMTLHPALLAIYLGPWSDKNGRTGLIGISLLAQTIDYVLLCVLSILEVNPYWFLLAPITSSLFGGFPAIMMALVCYVSDISDGETRAWHLVWFDSIFCSGTLIGILLSPMVFNHYGYTVVFGISAICLFSACIYSQCCVPETIQRDERSSFWNLCDCNYFKESFIAVFKKREGFDRGIVWKCIICIALSTVFYQGNATVAFMFTSVRLGWNISDYSIFVSTSLMLSILGSMATVPFIKSIGLPDTTNVFLCTISLFASSITKALTKHPWQMYLSGGIAMFGATAIPVLRAIVSNNVPHQDLGKIFSLITAMETLVPFVTTPLYLLIYNEFLPPIWWPCPVWFLPASISVVVFTLTCLIQRRISRQSLEYDSFVEEND